jgi:hypothetical protein
VVAGTGVGHLDLLAGSLTRVTIMVGEAEDLAMEAVAFQALGKHFQALNLPPTQTIFYFPPILALVEILLEITIRTPPRVEMALHYW